MGEQMDTEVDSEVVQTDIFLGKKNPSQAGFTI